MPLTIEQIATDENRRERGIGDGVHDVTAVAEVLEIRMEEFHSSTVLRLKDDQKQKIVDFCNKHPDWRVGEAYQCYYTFFLSSPPAPFGGEHTGSGFNHGSANLLTGCPSKLLILAEDD